MAYWDTSCLVKLYAPERDSNQLKAHVIGGATVVTSEMARLEFWVTLRRKESAGDLHVGGARKALDAYNADIRAGLILVEAMDLTVLAKFEEIVDQCHGYAPPLPLRTLDAIHLATVAVTGESQVVTTDKRMREAALRVGFGIYPPP
jgi:predicted nucleic acid-binding protein